MADKPFSPAEIGKPDAANASNMEAERIRELEARCSNLEAALAHANNSLGTYFDFAFVGIIETDDAFVALRANQAALSILGASQRTIQGKSLSQLLLADKTKAIERHLSLLREQGIAYTELSIKGFQGSIQQLVLNSIQSDEHHYIHFFDDVTEQRRASAMTEQALRAVEASDRAKSAFLANISHEIRTPLNGIIGLSRLAETAAAELRSEYLEKIHESGVMLLSIVNDLLDYAKIEAGAMDYECAPIMLDDLLDDVAACLGYRTQSAKVDFAFIPDPQVPDLLVGDRMRIAQCLSNLLNNALKFTQAGHVYLHITLDGVADGASRVRFAVSDSGIGIAQEVLSGLFVPFAQADVSTARRYGGTGLGLALVKQMVEGMGGELRAESTPDVGSCFSFSLPMLESYSQATAAIPNAPDNRRTAPVGTALVSCVQSGTGQATAAMLERRGWQVRIVPELPDDLREADLLVTDASPSKLKAFQTASRELPPTLVASSEQMSELPQGCRYLSLPVLPTVLHKAVEMLLHGDSDPFAKHYVPPNEFAGIHVLVAEDNPVNQKLLLGLLEQAGIRVSLAHNGQEAVALMQSLTPKPAMILMDVQMPEMDGLQATSRLRAAGFSLPIIAMSAGVSNAERSQCDLAGFSDFIPKPIDFDELWGVMTRWVTPGAQPSGYSVLLTTASPQKPADFLRPVIDVFISHHATAAERMALMLRQGDLSGIGRIVHQVKGVAPQVGAPLISKICIEIEAALAANNVDVLSKLIDDFATAYVDFVKHQHA